jgi:hypothetical protein
MKIFLFLILLIFGEEEKGGLLNNQKEKALKELMEMENPTQEEIDCIKNADNRNALNRCKKALKERNREKKEYP